MIPSTLTSDCEASDSRSPYGRNDASWGSACRSASPLPFVCGGFGSSIGAVKGFRGGPNPPSDVYFGLRRHDLPARPGRKPKGGPLASPSSSTNGNVSEISFATFPRESTSPECTDLPEEGPAQSDRPVVRVRVGKAPGLRAQQLGPRHFIGPPEHPRPPRRRLQLHPRQHLRLGHGVQEAIDEHELVILRVLVGVGRGQVAHGGRIPIREAPPDRRAVLRPVGPSEARSQSLQLLVQHEELLHEARVGRDVRAAGRQELEGLLDAPRVAQHEVRHDRGGAAAIPLETVHQNRVSHSQRIVHKRANLLYNHTGVIEHDAALRVFPGEREVSEPRALEQVRQLFSGAVDHVRNLVQLQELQILRRFGVAQKQPIFDLRGHAVLQRHSGQICATQADASVHLGLAPAGAARSGRRRGSGARAERLTVKRRGKTSSQLFYGRNLLNSVFRSIM
eukprot:scaffold462_cov195-Pinguiococcus_pyrenoidosus.AAC.93